MSTATIPHRSSTLSVVNLLLACGAAVLAVVAITNDDVGSTPSPSVVAASVRAADPDVVCGFPSTDVIHRC